MKRRVLRKSFYIPLVAMLGLMVSQVAILGQTADTGVSQAGKLEGTWIADVTHRDCQTGDATSTSQNLLTYVHGGSMLQTGTGGADRSPGHGVWHRGLGER